MSISVESTVLVGVFSTICSYTGRTEGLERIGKNTFQQGKVEIKQHKKDQLTEWHTPRPQHARGPWAMANTASAVIKTF
ncbi:hypothetical protein PG985_007994 [Apiospora marii]|uniref:uncharacterized protein n=1 Tax=Apiospora marii TaxID=335849 RepID=UPI003130D6F0